MPIISALGRLMQEDCDFEASLSCVARVYIVRSCLINKQKERLQGCSSVVGFLPTMCKAPGSIPSTERQGEGDGEKGAIALFLFIFLFFSRFGKH
jgi:hypothetical protein